MADNTAEIARLEAILNAGAQEVTVDGQRVRYDFGEIRRRLVTLRNTDDAATNTNRRPAVARLNLSSGF